MHSRIDAFNKKNNKRTGGKRGKLGKGAGVFIRATLIACDWYQMRINGERLIDGDCMMVVAKIDSIERGEPYETWDLEEVWMRRSKKDRGRFDAISYDPDKFD